MSIKVETTVTIDGAEYVAEIGVVERTSLGYEDHGIFTAWLHLSFGGTGQGAGGYALSRYDKSGDRQAATEYGMAFILELMRAVSVRQWEDIEGKRVLALRDEPYGLIKGIASIDGGHAFIFESLRVAESR